MREAEMAELKVVPLAWSEERDPCEECRYNHVVAESPLGRFTIDWKGWKEDGMRDLSLGYEYIGSFRTTEDAKAAAVEHMESVCRALLGCPLDKPPGTV